MRNKSGSVKASGWSQRRLLISLVAGAVGILLLVLLTVSLSPGRQNSQNNSSSSRTLTPSSTAASDDSRVPPSSVQSGAQLADELSTAQRALAQITKDLQQVSTDQSLEKR
jgi:hypothetical protein